MFISASVLAFGVVGINEMVQKKDDPYLIAFVALIVSTSVIAIFISGLALTTIADQQTSAPAAQAVPAARAPSDGASRHVAININNGGYGSVAAAA